MCIRDSVVNYKNCIIVIKNVPCLECEQCGEKYYTDEVAERLETIVNMAKKLMQEIACLLYTSCDDSCDNCLQLSGYNPGWISFAEEAVFVMH